MERQHTTTAWSSEPGHLDHSRPTPPHLPWDPAEGWRGGRRRGRAARQGSPHPATAAAFCPYRRGHPAGMSLAAYTEDPHLPFPTTRHLIATQLLLLSPRPVYLRAAVIVTTRPHLPSKRGRPNVTSASPLTPAPRLRAAPKLPLPPGARPGRR